MGIQAQLTAWTTEDPEPPAELIATNLDHTPALQAQTQIGWGHFFNRNSKNLSTRSVKADLMRSNNFDGQAT
jgi:hypothetical protein